MSNFKELLDLAARLRAFAQQTSLDHYAAQMQRAAAELEHRAASQRAAQATGRKNRVA
jgi:hypothetical protein